MKIQFKRNSANTSTLPSSANPGEPIWYKDQLYIGSVGGSKIDGTTAPAEGALIGIARADHDHAGVYQPIGTYLTTFNDANNYAFKTITPANNTTVETFQTINTTSVVADSNTDTLTISASNKWLSVAGDATNDIISIGHRSSGVTAGTYKSVTVDAAGHVTAGTNPTTLAGYGITDGDKVKQVASTVDVYGRLMITSYNTPGASGSITDNVVNYAYYSNSIMANPSTGDVVSASYRASGNNVYVGSGTGSQCHQQYDATNQCLKFIFD